MFLSSPAMIMIGGGDDIVAYAPLLVPIATLLTGYLAYLGIKRGRGIEESQQKAKNRLDERAQSFTELTELNERLNRENEQLRQSRDSEVKRVRDEVERVAKVHRENEDRCRRQFDSLLMQMETLRTLVVSEVVKASADQSMDTARTHLGSHDQDTP